MTPYKKSGQLKSCPLLLVEKLCYSTKRDLSLRARKAILPGINLPEELKSDDFGRQSLVREYITALITL
jgi:hypothetical protein